MCFISSKPSSGLTGISRTSFLPMVGRWWWTVTAVSAVVVCLICTRCRCTVSDYRGITEKQHSSWRCAHGGVLWRRCTPWPCFEPIAIHEVHFAFSWRDQLYISSAYYFKRQPFCHCGWSTAYLEMGKVFLPSCFHYHNWSSFQFVNRYSTCTLALWLASSSEITSSAESIMMC